MSTVWLVVRRELVEKMRSRAFWIMNGVLVLLLVAAAVLPVLLGDDGPDTVTVAAVGDDALAIAQLAASSTEGSEDLVLEVQQVADRETAELAVRDDDVDLAMIGADEVIGLDHPDGRGPALLENARQVTLLDGALADAGVDAGTRSSLLSPAPLTRTALDGNDDEGPSGAATATGLTAVFVLYGLLIFYGQQIAQGIVQEKQSRVIEVLLATVEPVQLLGGKLLGLGLLGLIQVAALSGVGYLALALSGRDTIPAEAVPTLLVTIGFFVLGYALYATIFALAAAVVAKMEDLQTAMTVPILMLVGSFFLAQFALAEPDGTVAMVAGLLPPSAPIVQPLRVAVGTADLTTSLIAIAGVVATTAVLVPIAARVHAGAALMTRQRISVGDALRRNKA